MKGIFLEELGELQLRMIDGGGISEVAEDLLLIGGGASAAGSGSALTYAAATATGKMVTVLGVEVAKGLAAATGVGGIVVGLVLLGCGVYNLVN